jgi:hypothetical protein
MIRTEAIINEDTILYIGDRILASFLVDAASFGHD